MPFEYLDNYKFTPFSHRGGSIENYENTIFKSFMERSITEKK